MFPRLARSWIRHTGCYPHRGMKCFVLVLRFAAAVPRVAVPIGVWNVSPFTKKQVDYFCVAVPIGVWNVSARDDRAGCGNVAVPIWGWNVSRFSECKRRIWHVTVPIGVRNVSRRRGWLRLPWRVAVPVGVWNVSSLRRWTTSAWWRCCPHRGKKCFGAV